MKLATFQKYHSGDSWMCPGPNVPRSGKSLHKPDNTWVFMGKLSPRIPRLNTINTMVVHCYLDVPLEVRINSERINGLFHLLINGVFLGVK